MFFKILLYFLFKKGPFDFEEFISHFNIYSKQQEFIQSLSLGIADI